MNLQRNELFIEELLTIPRFSSLRINHAKNQLAFYYNISGQTEIYSLDLSSHQLTKITEKHISNSMKEPFIWSGDDAKVIYCKDSKGDEKYNIYCLNIKTREEIQLTDKAYHDQIVCDASIDGNYISYVSTRVGQLNVYIIDINGDNLIQITDYNKYSYGGKFSPDGKYISFNTNETKDTNNWDIYLAKTDGSDLRKVVQIRIGSQEEFVAWANDGKSFCFNTNTMGIKQVGIYNLETKQVQLFGDKSYDEKGIGITYDNKFLLTHVNNEATLSTICYNISNGEKKELDISLGVNYNFQLGRSKIFFISNTSTSPSQLVSYDFKNDVQSILLKNEIKDINKTSFIQDCYIKYPSNNETIIPAIIYKPNDYTNIKKYPAIIIPHGGPTAQYFRSFNALGQILSNRGYVAMFPNVRGSTGYGNQHRDACLKNWGGSDLEDLIRGRDWIVNNLSVDPERIGLYGSSYGGYLTLLALTKRSDLWKAGCSVVGWSSLKSFFEKSSLHYKQWIISQMGYPEENSELWYDRSPINFVHKLKASLLIIHGTNDVRVSAEEGRRLRNKLLEHGKVEGMEGDFEFVEHDDIGHGLGDSKVAIRQFKLVTDFFDRRI